MKSYDSVIGGKLLLALAYERDIALNITKVQKMLYIIYGYFLANESFQIFKETPKAWPYGPVFPRTRKKINFDIVYKVGDEDLKDIYSDEGVVNVFKKVIDKYSKFTATQLSDWSHMEGGAWDRTTKLPNFEWNQEIPDEFISEYFSNIKVI